MILDIDPNAKGLIFDLDGTIVDSMPLHYIALRNAAARYGVDLSVELFERNAGVPLYPTVEKLNEIFKKNMDPRTLGDAKEQEFLDNIHKISVIEPVLAVIRRYHTKLPMSVGTGGEKVTVAKTMSVTGLSQFFDIVVTADDVSRHKPDPETFLQCAERMGVEPRFCQVFEDGQLGLQAARDAGMMAVDVTEYYEVQTGRQ